MSLSKGATTSLTYDELDDDGDDQDSDGYELRLGTGLDLTSVLFGEAFVGYRVQQFDQDGSDDEQGISFGADINWNVTELTSVSLTAQRDFEPSDQDGANSNFRTQVGINVAHELLRNVVVDGSANYINDDFRGNDDSEDDIIRLGVGATYWVNRNASLNAAYQYATRDSSDAGEDYVANEVSIGLTLRF